LNDAGSPEDAELSHQHRSSRYSPDLQALWLVQDLMSAQALLGLLSQSFTLLVRGQVQLGQFPFPLGLPEGLYYVIALFLCVLHMIVLGVRSVWRSSGDSAGPQYDDDASMSSMAAEAMGSSISNHAHTYAELHWGVWLLMFLLPALGVVVGVLVNREDNHHYCRYLQFLRLEFDTRLGMHSPR
jgi:hypothetical protein